MDFTVKNQLHFYQTFVKNKFMTYLRACFIKHFYAVEKSII